MFDQLLKLPPTSAPPKLVAADVKSKSLLPPSTLVASRIREVRVSIKRKSIAMCELEKPADTELNTSPIKPPLPTRVPELSSSNSVTAATTTISAPSISPYAAPDAALTRPDTARSCSDSTASSACRSKTIKRFVLTNAVVS